MEKNQLFSHQKFLYLQEILIFTIDYIFIMKGDNINADFCNEWNKCNEL